MEHWYEMVGIETRSFSLKIRKISISDNFKNILFLSNENITLKNFCELPLNCLRNEVCKIFFSIKNSKIFR